MALYPLLFDPIYKHKVWGGRTLEAILGRSLPSPNARGEQIGESWEIADLPEAGRSVIANGPLAGRTLHELMRTHRRPLLGRLEAAELNGGPAFPLLVKYLDARRNLSVQVHPSPQYVREHPDMSLKDEAWYILDAGPDSVIYKGVKAGVTAERFRNAIEAGTVTELLTAIRVKPGDCHFLPSGTCHALGGGIVVAEVQTPSDVTFRVYDWGRTDRELHIEQALRCIRFDPPNVAENEKRTRIERPDTMIERLCQCEHFRIERHHAAAGHHRSIPAGDGPTVWMVLRGSGRITCRGAGCDEVRFDRGTTMLLPADLRDGRLDIDGEAQWLSITFPQASAMQIA